MRNNAQSLNDNLFEIMETLLDEEAMSDREYAELALKRASAISNIGRTIVQNANLSLRAMKLKSENETELPKYLEDK